MKIAISIFYKLFYKISKWLKEILKQYLDPGIHSFSPNAAYSGAIIEIEGHNFSTLREDNEVTIGGISARVIEAGETRLKVISAVETVTGKIKVKVGEKEGSSMHDFVVKPYPLPGSEDDGPPVLYQGVGFPSEGDVGPIGILRILVCLVNPTDRVPVDPVNVRNVVIAAWNNVSTFYNQVSYGSLTVQIDFFNNWQTLSGNFNDYIDTGISNIRPEVLSRLMAEAASFAEGTEGRTLNNYQMIACVINLNEVGESIRAWGGSSTNNFRYDDLSINITTTNPINELWVESTSDWGRLAHETGHNIVSSPFVITGETPFGGRTLGEDIYGSDLIDSSVASAQNFDMMGNHNSHPMFSAYHMEKTGWYNAANIRELVWDRNAFSQEFEIAAHGASQDSIANWYHLVKIKVGPGLFYYIEVRQRPAAAEYIFDANIPVPGGDGGVIVTKVVTDTVHNNQQMRFISLLHKENVLRLNGIAEDPARALKITVVNDNVAARPLVCRVKVEWAQNISDDPAGQFDLRIDSWDSNWQTPDIWIDRNPFGTFDKPNDGSGRPQGNGDKPRPQQMNKFFARIHNDGAIAVNNVNVTFYSVNPPGIGDNGNWSPIRTETISSINNNAFEDIFTNWVPVLGEHTCLKVFISQQSGEISGGNNAAQENVFDFEAPASSVPQAVYIPLAVRNPTSERTMIRMSVTGVKIGYIVQFPHEWVWLDPLEEKKFFLTVVPYLDYPVYKALSRRYKQQSDDYASRILVTGYLPKLYKTQLDVTGFPGSKFEKIGGIFSNVKPKKKVRIEFYQERKENRKCYLTLSGIIIPALQGQTIHVELQSPLFNTIIHTTETNDKGQFQVVFDMKAIADSQIKINRIKDYQDFTINANLTAQAFVFDALEAAEAQSDKINVNNTIFLE